jgi:hypothetical protein
VVARGHVRNGVVVLDDGIHLPEGQEVTVIAPRTAESTPSLESSHSLLNIPPVSLGPVLCPLGADDDLLGEMLEGRP